MPELPEVETTRLAISPCLIRQTITQVVIRKPKLRLPVSPELQKLCPGQKIQGVSRRAKYLILTLSEGYILIHLGMSGKLYLTTATTTPQKHDHIELRLENGLVMRYYDPRRFGLWLYLNDHPKEHALLTHLGPEPLTEAFNASYLLEHLRHKKQSIKSALMNSSLVAGIGNIYATESLFLARIHPLQPAGTLAIPELTLLVNVSKKVLKQAIDLGGTTLRDFYSPTGKLGYFINQLQVYGRKDKPCFQCDTFIETVRIANRASAFCPTCQLLK